MKNSDLKPVKIKNFAQLKRELSKGGAMFYIQNHWKKENIGQMRSVNIVQTNGIYTVIPDDCKHEISNANQGKGSWLEFGKASAWEFVDDECGVTHCILKNIHAKNNPDEVIIEIVVMEEV